MSPESKRILLVSARGPGSFQGIFDTDRSREHHTLKEAVIVINPDNRDSTCSDDYPPCPSYRTRRLWSGKDVVLQLDVDGHFSPLSEHLEMSGGNIVAHPGAGDRFAVLQQEWGAFQSGMGGVPNHAKMLQHRIQRGTSPLCPPRN